MSHGIIAGLVLLGIAAALVVAWVIYEGTIGADGPAQSEAGLLILAFAALIVVVSIITFLYHFSGIQISQKGG